MPADRFGEPWPDATYHGFSGAPGPRPPRRGVGRPSRGAVIGGLACVALALGLAAGFAFRPDHRSLSVDDAEARARPMPIEVSQPPPPAPLPQPAGKLDVLSPTTAEAARAAQSAWSVATTTPMAAPATSPAASRDGLDGCAARSRAEALVCADPELAAYDREMGAAYRRAMRSGAVAPQDLQADQRDWLDDRERAARRSPEAVAQAYQDRIEELNRIADDGPGADDAGDLG
jgi:uncharacterized protein YecT (DUF1311 family)